MSALAASFFAFSALASVFVVVGTALRFGASARALTQQLRTCNETYLVSWSVIERPALGETRHAGQVVTMGRAVRPARQAPVRPRALGLAA